MEREVIIAELTEIISGMDDDQLAEISEVISAMVETEEE